MDPASAFQVGAGQSWALFALVIAGLGCTAVLLWAAWAYISTFHGWSSHRVPGTIAGRAVIRIALVVLLLSWVFLS